MSSSPVSAIFSQSAISFNAPSFDRVRDREDRKDSGDQLGGGVSLFSALLQALVSAVQQPSSAGSTSSGSPAAPVAASSSTGSTTATSATTATTSSTASSGAGGSSNAVPMDSLAQDLQSFLHDLFRALRGARHQEFEGRRESEIQQPAAAVSAPATIPAASSTTSAATGTPSTTTTSTSSGGSSSGVALGTGDGTNVASTGTPAFGYHRHGLINALKQLILDLSNSASQTAGASAASANGFMAQSLTNLNTAFNKLVDDLRALNGNGGTSSSSSSSGASSASASGSDTSQGTANAAALQSFLNNFLKDLESGGASSSGQLINTSA